jgi:hypothetical protein
MRKFLTTSVIVGGLVLASVGTAAADEIIVEVPYQVIEEGPPGTESLLAEESVAPDLQGLVCSGDLVAQNNESIHPGNNIRVTSGTSEVVLLDVEASANQVTPLTASITLGPQIRVVLIMGPDEVYSGEFRLQLQCEQPAPPEPTPEPTVESTVAPTTTDAAAGGGQAPASQPPTDAADASAQQLPATGPDTTARTAGLAVLIIALGVAITAVSRRAPSA